MQFNCKVHTISFICTTLHSGQTIYAGDLNGFELIQKELDWIEQGTALKQ